MGLGFRANLDKSLSPAENENNDNANNNGKNDTKSDDTSIDNNSYLFILPRILKIKYLVPWEL